MAKKNLELVRGFGGRDKISEADWFRCEVTSHDNINDILASYGWNGGAACCILLHLSVDNTKVDSGQFMVRGAEERDFKIDASKVWQDADMNVTLTIRMPSMDSFSFSEGGLASDLLDDTEVINFLHTVHEGGPATPILQPDLRQLGIGHFCLRLVCNLSRSTSTKNGVRVKYTLMLFPVSKSELSKMSQHHVSGSWPGIKLGEGDMSMMPAPTTAWVCPILPLIKPGRPFKESSRVPSTEMLKRAMGAIMTKCAAPDAGKNHAAVLAKWDKIVKSPTSFVNKIPPLSWPAQSQAEPIEGS